MHQIPQHLLWVKSVELYETILQGLILDAWLFVSHPSKKCQHFVNTLHWHMDRPVGFLLFSPLNSPPANLMQPAPALSIWIASSATPPVGKSSEQYLLHGSDQTRSGPLGALPWHLPPQPVVAGPSPAIRDCILTQKRTNKCPVRPKLANAEVSNTSKEKDELKVGEICWNIMAILFPSRLFLISALAAVALGQEDNFECPDEFLGFYPHLYRYVWVKACL